MPQPGPRIEDLVGLNFPYLQADERVQAKFRPDIRLVFAEVAEAFAGGLIFAIVAVVLPVYAAETEEVSGEAAFSVYAVAVLFPAAVAVLQRTGRAFVDVYFTQYVVTDQRLYSVTAFLERKVKVVPFEKVTNLQVRRSPLQHLLGVAEIRVVAYGVRGTQLELRGLRHPRALFEGLNRDVRRHSSVEALLASD